MKYILRVTIVVFILAFAFNASAQKKTKTKLTSFDFTYNGEKYLIQKGTIIQLGMGSADNGSFNYIKQWQGVTVNRYEVNMKNDKSNKFAEIVSFNY